MTSPWLGTLLAHSMPYQIPRTRLRFQGRARIAVASSNPTSKAFMKEALATGYPEKKGDRRAKMARPVRVRPSEPRDDHFEDLPHSRQRLQRRRLLHHAAEVL